MSKPERTRAARRNVPWTALSQFEQREIESAELEDELFDFWWKTGALNGMGWARQTEPYFDFYYQGTHGNVYVEFKYDHRATQNFAFEFVRAEERGGGAASPQGILKNAWTETVCPAPLRRNDVCVEVRFARGVWWLYRQSYMVYWLSEHPEFWLPKPVNSTKAQESYGTWCHVPNIKALRDARFPAVSAVNPADLVECLPLLESLPLLDQSKQDMADLAAKMLPDVPLDFSGFLAG